jgi:hypothetical protein
MAHTRSALSKSPSSKRQSAAKIMYRVEDADDYLQSEHNVDLKNTSRNAHPTEGSVSGSKMQRASYLSQPKSVKGRTIETTA